MKNSCIHGIGEIHENEIGEKYLYCEEWACDRNITLGDCLNNCGMQENEGAEDDEVKK